MILHKLALISHFVLLGGTGADLGSTVYATSHGFQEANPLVGQSKGIQVVTIAASTVAVETAAKSLEDAGHRRAAVVLRFIVGGTHGGAAIYNVYALKKAK